MQLWKHPAFKVCSFITTSYQTRIEIWPCDTLGSPSRDRSIHTAKDILLLIGLFSLLMSKRNWTEAQDVSSGTFLSCKLS